MSAEPEKAKMSDDIEPALNRSAADVFEIATWR
jgi:hypothetical protein